jgi:hypothetical protein
MIKDSVGGWKQGAKTISGLCSYFQRPEVKGLKWRPIFCPISKVLKAAGISAALFELPLILIEQPEFAIRVVFSSHSVAFGVTSSGKTKTYR